MKNIIVLFTLTFVFSLHLSAQTDNQDSGAQSDIFETLRTIDPQNYAVVKLHQDERIEMIFGKKTLAGLSKTIYRVQVFSSNAQRTAKSEAYNVEKMLHEEFPGQTIYVNYSSPFWKVRIGEFLTRESAQLFRTQVVNAFPQKRNEIYIVPEHPESTNK